MCYSKSKIYNYNHHLLFGFNLKYIIIALKLKHDTIIIFILFLFSQTKFLIFLKKNTTIITKKIIIRSIIVHTPKTFRSLLY